MMNLLIKIIEILIYRNIDNMILMSYYQFAEYVGNIIAFKKYINLVLKSIDDGDYNDDIVRKLSDNAELFFKNNNIKDDDEDDDEQFNPFDSITNKMDKMLDSILTNDDKKIEFKPRIIEQKDDDDDSSSDTTESECDFIDTDSSDDKDTKKDVKYKDNLVNDFLNNNIDFKNYHYLKTNKETKVNYYTF